MTATDLASSKSSVQSLAKAFKVLEAVAGAEVEMTLSETAVAAGLDPGTTHRMLRTLVELGYVARGDDKRFSLTLKVLDLGFRAIGRRDMRVIARPILRSLVGEVSEAASLGVLSGGDILYVERMRAGITRLGVDIRVGTLIPAATSVPPADATTSRGVPWATGCPSGPSTRIRSASPSTSGSSELTITIALPRAARSFMSR